MRHTQGNYVGDGSNGRLITTGLSGTITRVLVLNINAQPVCFWTAQMEGFQNLINALGNAPLGAAIHGVGPDFTVDNDGPGAMNALGVDYYWQADSE